MSSAHKFLERSITPLKNSLKKCRLLYGAYLRLYFAHRNRWSPPPGSVEEILSEFCAAERDGLSFIQIGANTGYDQFTEIRKTFKWSGVFVEPQKAMFEILTANWGHDPRFTLVNAAISESDGSRTLYKPARDASGNTGLASFNRELFQKNIEFEQRLSRGMAVNGSLPQCTIETEVVPCLSFRTLVKRYGIDRVDILLIDTEGYDLEVLKLAEIGKLLPRLVVFEHINLSREDYREAVRLLRKERYQLWKDHSDTIGILSGKGE